MCRHRRARLLKAAMQPPVPRRADSPAVLKRFFAVYSDPRAYVSLFFMFLSLVTGCVYFTFAVTGLSLSAGLAILIIGLPVFIAFIGIARVISLGEGRLLEAVSGERMPRPASASGRPRRSGSTRHRDSILDGSTRQRAGSSGWRSALSS